MEISNGSITILSNIERTRTSFFEHWKNSNMFIYWWSNSNERTSNIEPNRAFTTFTKLLIELTRTSFFRTLNELEHVHLMGIKLEHPIFSFELLNIDVRTLFNPSLQKSQKFHFLKREHQLRFLRIVFLPVFQKP